MSPGELLIECPVCHRTHAANEGCDDLDESARCTVTAPVGPPVVMFPPAPSTPAWWVEQCHQAEQERDAARAGLADEEMLTRGLVSRLRDLASRIGPARRADDIRAALEEVLRGADCRDLSRDTALDEARQGRDVLVRELSRAQGDVADLARQRDEARAAAAQSLAVLRRWLAYWRWCRSDVAAERPEKPEGIARDTAAILSGRRSVTWGQCR